MAETAMEEATDSIDERVKHLCEEFGYSLYEGLRFLSTRDSLDTAAGFLGFEAGSGNVGRVVLNELGAYLSARGYMVPQMMPGQGQGVSITARSKGINGGGIHLTPEIYKQMIADGKSHRQIAEEIGCTPQGVDGWSARNGLRQSEAKPPLTLKAILEQAERVYPDSEKTESSVTNEEAVELATITREAYLTARIAGKNKEDIAREVGMSSGGLSYHVKRWGFLDPKVEQKAMRNHAGVTLNPPLEKPAVVIDVKAHKEEEVVEKLKEALAPKVELPAAPEEFVVIRIPLSSESEIAGTTMTAAETRRGIARSNKEMRRAVDHIANNLREWTGSATVEQVQAWVDKALAGE